MQASEMVKFSPIIISTTSSIISFIYMAIEYVSIILIFKKVEDEGVINYIPFLNNLKLLWRTHVLNTFIFAILLLILGPSLLGIGLMAIQSNPFVGLITVLAGTFLLILSFVLLIIANVNHVKNLEENPSIMSYICAIFFQPFYYVYMAFSKKAVIYNPSSQQKVKGSCVLGCLGLVIVFVIIIIIAILVGSTAFSAIQK